MISLRAALLVLLVAVLAVIVPVVAEPIPNPLEARDAVTSCVPGGAPGAPGAPGSPGVVGGNGTAGVAGINGVPGTPGINACGPATVTAISTTLEIGTATTGSGSATNSPSSPTKQPIATGAASTYSSSIPLLTSMLAGLGVSAVVFALL